MARKKKVVKDREIDKSRDFVCVLYPDNTDHRLIIMQLKLYRYNSVGVCHDSDVYLEDKKDKETGEIIHKEGELKKIHYHFILRFDNPRYISGVSKELGLEEHLIDFLDNYKAYATYMLHWDEPYKHQYDVDCFVGSLAGETKKLLIHKPEALQFNEIYEFIRTYDGVINYSIVYEYAYQKGYYGAFRRNTSGVREFIANHNERYYRLNHDV